MNDLGTVFSVASTVLLAVLIVLLLKIKRDLPDVQQILDDVGESIASQLGSVFEKPSVSKAMSVLGKKSGEARADKALRKRVAAQAMEQMPGIGIILDQFNLTPIEGLKLMNDPLIGPLIQRGIAAAQKGIGNLGKGGSGSDRKRSSGGSVFKVS